MSGRTLVVPERGSRAAEAVVARRTAEELAELRCEIGDVAASLLPLVAEWLDRKLPLDRLARKLKDPELADHPKRAAAEARWERLTAEIGMTDELIEIATREMAWRWDALDSATQRAMVTAGWPRPPRAGRGVEFAKNVFGTMLYDAEDQRAGRAFPSRPWRWVPPMMEEVPW